MRRTGRPIRFLGTVLGGWTLLRTWLLWPTINPLPALAHVVAPAVVAAPAPWVPARASAAREAEAVASTHRPAVALAAAPNHAAASARSLPVPPRMVLLDIQMPPAPTVAAAADSRYGDPVPPAPALRAMAPRLSGSAWLLARGTGPISAAPAGQLGGSQAGVRLSYTIDAARRLALNARFSAPLEGAGKEVGLGLAWRPTRAPVTLLAEERLPLDGGAPAPAVAAVGGLNPTRVIAGFRLEGYGQAGAVKRGDVQPFADGFMRLAHPVRGGKLAIDLGVGIWGGAQPGVARLDVGPTLGITLPPVDGHRLRVTADWRERVAGQARPGSGPTLSLGIDF